MSTKHLTVDTPLDIFYRECVIQLSSHWMIAHYLNQKSMRHFDAQNRKPPTSIVPADLPEFVVYCNAVGGGTNLIASTGHKKVIFEWALLVSTGQWDSRVINALLWGTIETLADWCDWARTLQYNGQQGWITDLRLNQSRVGFAEKDRNRQIEGFAAILDFEIDVQLNNNTFNMVQP